MSLGLSDGPTGDSRESGAAIPSRCGRARGTELEEQAFPARTGRGRGSTTVLLGLGCLVSTSLLLKPARHDLTGHWAAQQHQPSCCSFRTGSRLPAPWGGCTQNVLEAALRGLPLHQMGEPTLPCRVEDVTVAQCLEGSRLTTERGSAASTNRCWNGLWVAVSSGRSSSCFSLGFTSSVR